jgi:citrate lyase subunit beta / citryl-CoA lyase
MMKNLRRCLLFMPGHNRRYLAKATGIDVEMLCFDLQEVVPPDEKVTGRELVCEFIEKRAHPAALLGARINVVDSPYAADDVRRLCEVGADFVLVPKVHGPETLREVEAWIVRAESRAGRTEVMALIESGAGAMHVDAIVEAGGHLTGLMFGREDFYSELNATMTPEHTELLFIKSKIVLAGRTKRLDVLDSPCLALRDEAELARECRLARQLGFSGKAAIHPSHIGRIVETFTPSAEDMRRAERIVGEFRAARARGEMFAVIDGRLYEAPVVEYYETLLATVAASGPTR